MSTATDLTQHSASRLAALLAEGAISAEETARAHLDRIEALDPKLHAFTTVFRDEALAEARRADDERRRGEVRGPLHGLPVTIKESLDMAGQASTLGLLSRRELRATSDAAIVQLLKRAGAVVLGRTNVSQLLLFHESRNALFGQTANPWSLDHTPGGSSGGEAAAIASGMSPLGIGTDIGGSIRVPAHFAGIAGIKPTLDLWPNRGSNGALLGQELIRSQLGPMARTARDLALAFSALDPAALSAMDARVPPLALPDPATVDIAGLRVGFYVNDGMLPPSAAVARAVTKATSALHARGATVVPFTPPAIPETVFGYFSALTSDGGATVAALLKGAEVDPSLQSLRALAMLPPLARTTAARVAGLAGERRLQRLLESVGERPTSGLWRLTATLRQRRDAIFAAMQAERLDVVLCPPHATAALPHGGSRDFALAGSYAMLWNVCQFPAGVVPVTRVRPDETHRLDCKDRLERRAAAVDEKSAGLPVGVQVVGFPYRDHVVLAAMIAIEEALQSEPDLPVTPVAP
ncbi:amidase [Chondromyces apiculatus]|uniref:Glutamyl-tRNA(Gln) amidotransferase subunit A n=1 Tax=Chondromyces apiculatus DSM 436 TaxID=1192034 RepID=A0A017SXT0_9BACT|nr:amidase family protein [Chondromyces apiculatus]EYF01783.1 glutamyl-tRNA(Gln) amidotransferase subunit A [Chondromyces apiculatus DSM 436]